MDYFDVADIVIGLDGDHIGSVFVHVGVVAFGVGALRVVVSAHHIALVLRLSCLLCIVTGLGGGLFWMAACLSHLLVYKHVNFD